MGNATRTLITYLNLSKNEREKNDQQEEEDDGEGRSRELTRTQGMGKAKVLGSVFNNIRYTYTPCTQREHVVSCVIPRNERGEWRKRNEKSCKIDGGLVQAKELTIAFG